MLSEDDNVRNDSQVFGSVSGIENFWNGFLGTDPGGRLSFQWMLAAWLPSYISLSQPAPYPSNLPHPDTLPHLGSGLGK